MTIERRYAATEFAVRSKPSGGVVVEGHGAVFNRLSRNLGGFVEQIAPEAFTKTLADAPDVRALINHDPTHLLGRTRSGTLRLAVDSVGLAYEIDMPDRSDARDLVVSMERGDITQSSFAFYMIPGGDEWGETQEGFPLRTIRALSLSDGDVSPVTYPAYPDADSGLRERAYRSLAAATGVPLDAVVEAAQDNGLIAVVRNELQLPEDRGEAQGETHADPEWFRDACRAFGVGS